MSKTLRTYPDGSKITTNHVAAFAAGSITFSVALAAGMVWWDDRKNRKRLSKEIPGMFK